MRTGHRPRSPVLEVTVAEDPAARLAFSGRTASGGGNVSLLVGGGDVAVARKRLLAAVGSDPGGAVYMEQVHGGAVGVVGRADRGRGASVHADAIAGVDALVTRDTDVALVVLIADCVPLLLVDPGRGIAAVHAGRGGVVAGVVGDAVSALAPGRRDRLVAVLGPSIGGCCYEVPADLAQEVGRVEPQAVASTTWGTPSLDLPAAVRAQLDRLGVGRIEQTGSCTRCEPDRWFSHRADPAAGRQGAAVRRIPA